jgi:hypothetical protein
VFETCSGRLDTSKTLFDAREGVCGLSGPAAGSRTLGSRNGRNDGRTRWPGAWRYEGENGQKQAGTSENFASQSDAESWLGQTWRELVASGVVTAVLVEDDG